MTKKTDAGPSDYNALAAKYLDLWQEQIAKLAKDPQQLSDAAATWSRTAAEMMQNAATAMSASTDWNGSRTSPHDSSKPKSDEDTASGAKAPGSTHGDGGLDSADILRRLDALEERLAALESKSTKSGSSRRGSRGGKKT